MLALLLSPTDFAISKRPKEANKPMASAPKPVDPRPVSNGSTTALIVRTQQDFETYFKAQVEKIVGLSPEKTNIVAPVLQIRDRELLIEAGFVPELTLVNVKWDEVRGDDDKVTGVKSDDIYPVGGGKYALLLPVLEKIARAAGLTWDPDRSRLEHSRESDVYHAYGWLEMMPGHRVPCEATKAIDEETDLEEVTLNAIEKHKKWPKYNPALPLRVSRAQTSALKRNASDCGSGSSSRKP